MRKRTWFQAIHPDPVCVCVCVCVCTCSSSRQVWKGVPRLQLAAKQHTLLCLCASTTRGGPREARQKQQPQQDSHQ